MKIVDKDIVDFAEKIKFLAKGRLDKKLKQKIVIEWEYYNKHEYIKFNQVKTIVEQAQKPNIHTNLYKKDRKT